MPDMPELPPINSMPAPMPKPRKWVRWLFGLILVGSLALNFGFGYIFTKVMSKGNLFIGTVLSKSPEISFVIGDEARTDWMRVAYGYKNDLAPNTLDNSTLKIIKFSDTQQGKFPKATMGIIMKMEHGNDFDSRAKQLMQAHENLTAIPFNKDKFINDSIRHNRNYLQVTEWQIRSFADFWNNLSERQRNHYLRHRHTFKRYIENARAESVEREQEQVQKRMQEINNTQPISE